MKTINVVAAIIRDASGRVFCTQRGYGEWKDWWEFPGGKIEPGEEPNEALLKEFAENKQIYLRAYKMRRIHKVFSAFICLFNK